MKKDIYKDDIELQIIRANREGDLDFIVEIFASGVFNVLFVTESDDWNWLHRCNLINPSPRKIVQFYIDKGVEINAQDCYGMTPLHYAVQEHNIDAVLLLLEAGADPTIQNKKLRDSLRQSVMKIPHEGDVPMIEALIEYGADPHKKNQYGVTVFNNLERSSKNKEYLQDLVNKLRQ